MTTEPKLFTLAEAQDRFGDTFTAELRERGLIAEEPVDALLVEARGIVRAVGLSLTGPGDGAERCDMAASGDCDDFYENKIALAALRRGMELAPRKELTREMVRSGVIRSLTPRDMLEDEDFGPRASETVRGRAEDFVTRLHAALTEALR